MARIRHETSPNEKNVGRRQEKLCGIKDHKRKVLGVIKLLSFLIVLNSVVVIECSENESTVNPIDDAGPNVEYEEGRSYFENFYRNGTFNTGNVLWDNILNQCTVNPTVSCLQKNVYMYLDDSLGFKGDIKVTNGVNFVKNNVDIKKYSKEANLIYLTGSKTDVDINKREESRSIDNNIVDNKIGDDDESETPLEEVTDSLYDKGVQFLATHDMKVKLPELFFHGATLKISPRALTSTGALVHIDLEPKENPNGQGRIFFKKIKKYLKKKLLMAAIAIILVVKLIALKLIFVLPVIVGVTTAKKMVLKILLFFFPALSHIFKLCSWYHQNYHTTKFHHHHHLITHHHHKPPAHHSYGPPTSHHPNSLTVVHPQTHHDGPTFEHYPQDWELSGPGLGNEYIASGIHRNAIANFKPHVDDVHDINAWGLGLPPGQSSLNTGEYATGTNNVRVTVPSSHPNNYRVPHGNSQPVGPPLNPYSRPMKGVPKDKLQAEKEALIRAAALAARAPPSPVRDEVLRVSAAKLSETTRVQSETELVKQQQQILAALDPDTVAADKFYGGLVERVEKILGQMGAMDEGCRERAVCTLYKDPFQHTPYSNLVSNELSKDSSELLPPVDSKLALLYYRYVQAARDGQEHNDCLTLYQNCNLDYKKK